MVMRSLSFLVGSLVALVMAGGLANPVRAQAFGSSLPDLKVVPYVELNRYLGKWYEIASFPQSFQKGCTGVTAEYSLRSDGDIRVVNTCRLGSLDGKLKVAEGKAWVTDATTNAKLRVQFFWPFSGKYWIVDLGENYEYAVVGHPNRDYLWILSRTPQMDPAVYDRIVSRVRDLSFDTSRLVRTLQFSN
jgi:apolipoprotein D and lipocalin family protein